MVVASLFLSPSSSSPFFFFFLIVCEDLGGGWMNYSPPRYFSVFFFFLFLIGGQLARTGFHIFSRNQSTLAQLADTAVDGRSLTS